MDGVYRDLDENVAGNIVFSYVDAFLGGNALRPAATGAYKRSVS